MRRLRIALGRKLIYRLTFKPSLEFSKKNGSSAIQTGRLHLGGHRPLWPITGLC